MTTLLLYLLTVLIWGTTWIMMKYQLGEVAPAASLAYRYAAAGVIILLGAWAFGRRVTLSGREHLLCAVQGALMFSVNYWLTYLAAEHLTTGIISVFFAGAAATTMMLNASWQRHLPSARAMFGACLGICGIVLVFWPEVERIELSGPVIFSGLILILSVCLFSVGGLVGARNLRTGMPRFGTIGWAMIYGSVVMAGVTVLRGETFGFSTEHAYLLSLAGLTLLGSVAVFVLYFTVVERIGPEKASYATVMFPLVALGVSTFAEGYTWPTLALIGVPLALIGNGLVLSERPSPAPTPDTPSENEPGKWPVNIVDLPEDCGGVAQDTA